MKTRTVLHAVALAVSASIFVAGFALANPFRATPILKHYIVCPNIGAMQPGDYTDANGNPVFVNTCHLNPNGGAQ